ncbi:MAG: hypothetical protein IPI30_12385 [Saprospiraceae bacterium]|nr:hypothetical protein [Candidatus Vicinibacter affinis]
MTSKLTKFSTFLLLLGLVILNNGCKNDTGSTGNDTSIKKVSDYPNEVVYEWNELFLKIERYAAGYRPGPAPTALGYMGFAVYEATAPGFSEYKSIQNNFPKSTFQKLKMERNSIGNCGQCCLWHHDAKVFRGSASGAQRMDDKLRCKIIEKIPG